MSAQTAPVSGESAHGSEQSPAGSRGDGDLRGIPAGLIAYRQALLAYRGAKDSIAAKLTELRKAIPAAMPNEAELADSVAAQLGELNDELGDAIDAAMNAVGDA